MKNILRYSEWIGESVQDPPINLTYVRRYINGTAWSACFISHIYKQAYSDFPSRSTHTGYATAIKSDTNWKVLNPQTTPLQIGDIVVKNRAGNSQRFENKTYHGYSHGDIVTEIKDSKCTMVGGNTGRLSNKVCENNLTLDEEGKIENVGKYFVVLRPNNPDVGKRAQQLAQAESDLWEKNNWTENQIDCLPYISSYYASGGIPIPKLGVVNQQVLAKIKGDDSLYRKITKPTPPQEIALKTEPETPTVQEVPPSESEGKESLEPEPDIETIRFKPDINAQPQPEENLIDIKEEPKKKRIRKVLDRDTGDIKEVETTED